MNGFIFNGRPLLVEPKRQVRVPSDRNLRKFSGNGSGAPPEHQAGVAPHETSPHAHKAPGGEAGLFSQLHRDGTQMASQYPPCIPVQIPQQFEVWIPDPPPGYGGPVKSIGPSPQNRHPRGPTAVSMPARGHAAHSRDSNNPTYHGPPANNDADYPPLDTPTSPNHDGIDGVPSSKSPKKFKKTKGYKKQLGRRNTRNEADN